MLTEQNKTFALIVDNHVTWIFNKNNLPRYNENHIQTVDITNLSGIEVGDVYDPVTMQFSKPEEVIPPFVARMGGV